MSKYEEVHFVDTAQSVWNYSLFTDEDIRNFQMVLIIHYINYLVINK